MNIFILDKDPESAARMLCDKHLIKMILESAQLLCSPYEPGAAPYKRTHYNHPCSKWIRESRKNYKWLLKHALAMCDEYESYYKKVHKSKEVILWCKNNMEQISFDDFFLTPFVQAMPDKYKNENPIQAYRDYYLNEKREIAKWNHGRKPPEWWTYEN